MHWAVHWAGNITVRELVGWPLLLTVLINTPNHGHQPVSYLCSHSPLKGRQNLSVGRKQRRRWEWRCCNELARREHHTQSGRLGFLLLSRGNTRFVGHMTLKSCTPKVDAAAHTQLPTSSRYLAHAGRDGREQVSGFHPFNSAVFATFFFSVLCSLIFPSISIK